MIRSLSALALALLLGTPAWTQTTILASGRVRGDLMPCECEQKPVGGLAQRVQLVETLLAQHPGGIWLDAGNGLYDSPNPVPADAMPARRLAAITLIDAYNLGGLAAHNVGQYDLAEGVEYLHRLELRAVFPFVSANLWWSEDQPQEGLHFARDLIIRTTTPDGPHAVGITGVLAGGLQGYGWHTSDPVAAAKASIKDLRKRGAEAIVVLTDVNIPATLKLAKKLPPVDLIISSGDGSLPAEGVVVKKSLVARSTARGRGLLMRTLGQAPALEHHEVQRQGPQDPKVQRLVQEMLDRATLPVDPPDGESPAAMDGSAPFLPPPSQQEIIDSLPVDTLEPGSEPDKADTKADTESGKDAQE